MKIEFTSISELREFINFFNEAKDQVLEEEVAQLNKTDKELKNTVDNTTVNTTQGEKTNGFTSSR